MSEQTKTPLQQIQLSPKKIYKLKDAAYIPIREYTKEKYGIRFGYHDSGSTTQAVFAVLPTKETPDAVTKENAIKLLKTADCYAQDPNDPNHNNVGLIFISAWICLVFDECPIDPDICVYIASLSDDERFEVAFRLLKKGIALGDVMCLYFYCIYNLNEDTYAEDLDKYIKMLIKTDYKYTDALLKVRQLYTPKPDYF